MSDSAQPLYQLIEELKRIPGIGAKTAQRIAFHILGLPQEEAERLAEAIREVKKRIFYCSACNNITHIDPCSMCADGERSTDSLCIVEEPYNISSIEKTGIYHGRYHVLLGTLAPLRGVGPEELKLDKLIQRVEKGTFQEIIIATNPTSEGEATALYLAKILKSFPAKLTRLAMGLPVGSDIDFADQVTIKKALEGRTELKE
ncbi:MAG: recombination mediator RecR [Candidatus Aminicenantes bacterium]|nr:recombination mediator RecR [Candidatus Aminicenantes bacterium]